MSRTDIKPSVSFVGLELGVVCTVLATTSLSADALQVYYRLPDGTLKERLLGPAVESSASPAIAERPWALDGDGAAFQLACESKRIDLAFLFEPVMAVDTSNVDPLPHQITAVYQSLLPRQLPRFVLVDDPGVDKTIMAAGYAYGKYEGFQFGKGGASLSDSVLLIAPEAAAQYESTLQSPVTATSSGTAPASGAATGIATFGGGKASPMTSSGDSKQPARPQHFRGAAEIPATLAKSRLNTIAEDVIALLASGPNAAVRITLEIDASFPDGASDSIRRGASENANNLGFNVNNWE